MTMYELETRASSGRSGTMFVVVRAGSRRSTKRVEPRGKEAPTRPRSSPDSFAVHCYSHQLGSLSCLKTYSTQSAHSALYNHIIRLSSDRQAQLLPSFVRPRTRNMHRPRSVIEDPEGLVTQEAGYSAMRRSRCPPILSYKSRNSPQ